jgi:glutamine phosphoribosylpyrophosphate amidotransferase
VDKLQQKFSFKEALEASVEELDGPFSYIIATSTAIGVARDKLGLRPAMIAHDKSGYFIASEECALVGVCEDSNPKYLGPGEVCVYELKGN